MIFKQYCAVFFTPTEGLDVEVVKISENDYNKMGGSGISIYTFTSALDVVILTDYFKSLDRNFLIFDLHKESSGFNILDKDKEYLLFGLLNDNKLNEYETLSNLLMDDILSESNNNKIEPKIELKSSDGLLKMKENDDFLNVYNNLSKDEINQELNKIIDKGIKNLTDKDKKILNKLSDLI
jgi:hypothetical protein